MNNIIDLTTPESALAYLKSLPADEAISLPGYLDSNTAGDAVRAITGYANANEWANNHGKQWEWTASELVEALELDAVAEAPQVAEIVAVSGIHSELPGSVDVSIRNHSMVRVALNWEHVEDGKLTDAATARIESEVKRKGGFDEINWAC